MFKRIRGFSLIEVVVAVAMLALIAIPAFGLATLAVSRSQQQLKSGIASEIKNKIDVSLRNLEGYSVFSASTLPSFWASRDLRYIEVDEKEGGDEENGISGENDKYYKIDLRYPDGYSVAQDDSFAILVYEITWPHNTSDQNREQMFTTSVFRK